MIEVKDLRLNVGNFSLKGINLDVRDGEYFVLLGPTGSGKTMLLESIAGLKSLTSGQIKINGRDVTDLNLEKRNIGFAYQDYILYRHLSIRENISYGLMWRHRTGKELDAAVDKVVELLNLSSLLDRRPMSLSGGETQKIALARALAIKPDLLLLDEPLSAVDPDTKEAFERELRAIHDRLKLTTIHVTHNFEEAIAVADRIAVMGDGNIIQVGTPDEIFRRPASEFVARFVKTRNIFAGEVRDGSGDECAFQADGIRLLANTPLRGNRSASIRPEDILVSREPMDGAVCNCLQGTITTISNRGSIVYLTVDVPPRFICLVLPRTVEELGLAELQKVYIGFKASAVNIF